MDRSILPGQDTPREAQQLVIREQPRLPLTTQIEICADGIYHRLFRSLTTLVVVALAVAFLMNMLTESATVSSCKRGAIKELRQQVQFHQLAAVPRWADDERAFQRRLASLQPASLETAVLKSWTQLPQEKFSEFQRQTADVERVQQWFDDLSVSYRRLLFETGQVNEPLTLLTEPGQWNLFAERLRNVPTLDVPRNLQAIVSAYPQYRRELGDRRQLVIERVAKMKADLGTRGKELDGWLDQASSDKEQGRALAAFLGDHGIAVADPQLQELAQEAHRNVQLRAFQRVLTDLQNGEAWQKEIKTGMRQDDALKALARKDNTGLWLTEKMAGPLANVIDPKGLSETAAQFVYVFRAEDLQVKLAAEYGSEEGMGTKAFWLVVVSMVVCIVGITNAMLVSVLERFREIATMKCLGALDGLIATLFLLEAAFLGVVGGIVGVVVGGLIGLGRMTVSYGGWIWTFFPAGGLLKMAGLSIVIGLLLTTLAAIYPAFKAAKMLPMEAMRVE